MVEQVNKGVIERSDAVQIAFLLLVAGNATMVNMINLGVVELLRNPEQKKELIENPKLASKFVEELCRYHTASAMAMKRVAKEDIELGGKVFSNALTDETCTMSISSADSVTSVSRPARVLSRLTSPPTGTRTSSPIRTSLTCTASSRRMALASVTVRIAA